MRSANTPWETGLLAVSDVYGDLCGCGKFPSRRDTGLCEWCTAKARRQGQHVNPTSEVTK